jgi:hypothetical protein
MLFLSLMKVELRNACHCGPSSVHRHEVPIKTYSGGCVNSCESIVALFISRALQLFILNQNLTLGFYSYCTSIVST